MMKIILRRVRSCLLKSSAALRMASFSTCASRGGVFTGCTPLSIGLPFTVGGDASGPLTTGGPLLRPRTFFSWSSVAVTFWFTAVKSLIWVTVLL